MIRALLPLLLVLAVAGCAPRPTSPLDAAAEQAWQELQEQPDSNRYEAFINANRRAAGAHAEPDDARGIAYQARALEAQAAEAVRSKDPHLAHEVADRVIELRQRDLLGVYEERLPGSKVRFEAAEALVRPVLD